MAQDNQQAVQASQEAQPAPAPAPAPAKPMKKKKKKGWVAVVIVIVVLAGVGGGIAACSKSLSDSLQQMSAGAVETAKVEKRDIEDYISVSGKVESENMVRITSTVTAKVKNVFVEVGSEVKEGDILCEFDSSDFQQQYDTLAKTLENADGMTASSHKINQRNLENAKNERKIALEQADRAIQNAKKARDDAHKKEKDLVEKYNTAVKQRDEADTNMKNTLESGGSGMDMVLHVDCFLAHREDFALMNEIFDEYFLGQGVPTTRSVTEVTFTAPKFLFEIQAVAGVREEK